VGFKFPLAAEIGFRFSKWGSFVSKYAPIFKNPDAHLGIRIFVLRLRNSNDSMQLSGGQLRPPVQKLAATML